jgi:hypothetical protein
VFLGKERGKEKGEESEKEREIELGKFFLQYDSHQF